ncbi:BES1/BZR1 homolog protein 4-like [Punica granatum]|nr:BES1/BZR1 homolog protein 4-like [Punica granatum]
MRERERRAITTNIFQGLRKHGRYPLSARSDINQVLRHLAAEAGWVVEADGTTYRPSTPTQVGSRCSLCGCVTRTSANPTPTSSIIDFSAPTSPRNLSLTTSPRNPSLADSAAAHAERLNQLYLQQRASHAEAGGRSSSSPMQLNNSGQQFPTAFYMINGTQPQQQSYSQDVRVSSPSTLAQSP